MRTISGRSPRSISDCLQDIARHDRSHIKLAELGGDGSNQSFELSFSNLAHAVLRDKAPSLLDHEIGFQLLDRKDDNTKAVGVFGFKVGSHTLFAPVFFLEGDVKGHELLYIKEQDLFVPLTEGWLNYLLNRKPNILGDGVDRNTAQLGVRQPDLNRLAHSPWKYGAAMLPWAKEVFPKFAHTALLDVSTELDAYGREMSLSRFCREKASLGQLQWLVDACRRYPKIAQAVVEHHGGLDFISEAIKRARIRDKSGSVLGPPRPEPRHGVPPIVGRSVLSTPPSEHPIKRGALRTVTYDATQQTELPGGLDEEDAERLLRDGILIQDHRTGDEVSVPYNVQVEQKLSNPQETGIYQVLVKPGEFERCFIAHQPHGPNGRVEFCTIVRLDEGQRNWLNVHPSHIWCTAKIDGEDYDKWFDGLRDPDSLPKDMKRYMLVGPRGSATLPFQVENTLGDTEGNPSYEVDFSDRADHRYSGNILAPSNRESAYSGATDSWIEPMNRYDKWTDGQRIHLDSKEGTRIRSSMGDVWVPKGYKLLNLKPSEYDKAKDEAGEDKPIACGINDQGQSEPPAIRPGNLLDAELGIVTKMATVEMRSVVGGIRIGAATRSPRDALIHLVMDHGLAEDPAKQIIKNAQAAKGRPYVFHIKYAQPFMGDPYLTGGAPTAPGFPEPNMGGDNIMGWPGPTMSESEFMLPVDAGPTDNRGLYDIRPEAVGEPMDAALRGANSGQQEVFDTAMIGTMLKSVRDDTMIDRYLPDLVKGLDRLGRILFHFYWNGDQFADRFGQQDMPELEDTLRDAFELVGDTVLFLKQKTIEPYPEEDAADLELS